MTSKEYISFLKSLKKKPNAKELGAEKILPILVGKIKKRVHVDGKGNDGVPLGQYSTNPASFSKDAFYKKGAFKPKHPGGKFQFMKGGYKQLREVQGMKTEKIILDYSGQMKKSLVAKGKKVTIMGAKNRAVYAKNEDRFGDFYNPSKEEIEWYEEEITKRLKKRIFTRR